MIGIATSDRVQPSSLIQGVGPHRAGASACCIASRVLGSDRYIFSHILCKNNVIESAAQISICLHITEFDTLTTGIGKAR